MTKYCGEIKEVMGVGGGGYVAMGREDAQGRVTVPVGGMVKVATTIAHLEIGDTVLKKIRVCMDEVVDYIRKGDRACIYAFGHLWKTKIIIGVKSETGPSWVMSRGRFIVTMILYFTLWPFLVSLAAGLICGIVTLPFGGVGLFAGILYGVGISWFSAYRLFKTYREMQAD